MIDNKQRDVYRTVRVDAPDYYPGRSRRHGTCYHAEPQLDVPYKREILSELTDSPFQHREL